MNYRADIDGLRALAVTGVVIYHTFPNWLSGGYVGVDVFFVISGFLIASILTRKLEENQFSIADFYNRRIKRILPALIIVLAASLCMGWAILISHEFQLLGMHTAVATIFGTNFLLWSESGYFDSNSELKPLLHLWSLAIEEQFYVIFPLILFMFYRSKRPVLLLTITTVVSFLACIAQLDHRISMFYLPHNRIWELLLGACLNNLQTRNALAGSNLTKQNLLSFAGITLLGIACITFNQDSVFPGYLALIPTVGTALVIAAGPTACLNKHLLSARILVAIGLISYPLYLWHWPLLSFARFIEGIDLTTRTRVFCIAISFILAAATYLFIELPIRRNRHNLTPWILLVTGCIGYAGYLCNTGFIQPRSIIFNLEYFTKTALELGYPKTGTTPFTYRQSTFDNQGTGKKITLFIGDSNMQQFLPRTHQLLNDNPSLFNRAIYAVQGLCIPILHIEYDGPDPTECSRFIRDAYALALENQDIDTVVIAGSWINYFGADRVTKMIYANNGDTHYLKGSGSSGENMALTQLEFDINKLRNSGKRVFLILNIPADFKAFDPRSMIQRSWKNLGISLDAGANGIDRQVVETKLNPVNEPLRIVAKNTGAILLDPATIMCSTEKCPALTEDMLPIYWDDRHVNTSYARQHLTFLDPTIMP